ncbi:MAG: long-chain-fatty-acid--CoA ligase [Hyphomonadaceae bacterium]
MRGLMQDWPMTLDRLIDHAAAHYGAREIVTRSVEGPIVRTDYAAVRRRAKQVSHALKEEGVQLGDRIATLAWTTGRHFETWYGVMGVGAVLHTLNPRLFPDQIAWIAKHAGDSLLFVDLTFVKLVEQIESKLPSLRKVVIYCAAADMPKTTLKNAVAYEDWIAGRPLDTPWGGFDETTAAGLCYTSGTTGDPKGVLYSHRSNMLHALTGNQADAFGLAATDAIMPIAPLFHANAWGVAFLAPLAGAKMVMPGAKLDGASIHELLETEGVTVAAAVPTVWLMLLAHLRETGGKITTLKRTIIGGTAVPETILRAFRDDYGVDVIHAWGMTEMSPIGTLGSLAPQHANADPETKLRLKLKQGRAQFGVEMKIVDDAGRELPHDGKAFGKLLVRGPNVAKAYFRNEGARNARGDALDDDGWFDTGDVATIDADGYMQITDRAKDVIKSGGEWISSIEIENIALGAAGVANAAVIGVFHPRWDERPLLIVEPKPGAACAEESVLAFLNGKIAKWQMPDAVVLVDKIPLGATGKINKMALREMFKDYRLPAARAEN